MNTTAGPGNPPGFSKEHLEEHYRLYPAVHQAKIKEIEARLLRTDTASADSTYCPLRSLKKEQAYALNSVRLHSYFFGNTGGEGTRPSPELVSLLERDFGSLEEWAEQFAALAMCSRGWVVLGFDLTEGRLRNFFADDHSEGVWSVLPLLVLDVYEHAYCNAFPSRSVYVDVFMKCVNWEAVNRRLRAARAVFDGLGKNF
ncbi:MAG: Fe-Mn family superoxide dismutase [Peptococcaceae bacterium]|nr:Fe-Mn family superoxide dismutase [Peptococcaceae bacterium]